MTITKIFLLLVCAFVLVLLLSTIFNKHHRIIMWTAAIVFFIGTLLLIGLGIIDPVKDNHPDPVVITGIFTALVLSGVFAYGAEKLRIKLREKNQQTVQPILNVRIPPKGLYCREGLILHLPVQSLRKQ